MQPRFSDSSNPFSPELMEEKQWVRTVREDGSREAFEKIFRAYYKRLHGFAYSFVNQAETAEDIVQSVFLRIWSHRGNWNPPGTLKQYLFAAVRNEALNKIRHMKLVNDSQDEVIRSFTEFQSISEEQLKKQKEMDSRELRIKIQEAIDELPPKCRQIFLLNRRSGLTYHEIADYLDVSINTVNTQMGRALKSLRSYLSEYMSVMTAAGMLTLFF